MTNLLNIFLPDKTASNIGKILNVTHFTDLLLKPQSVSPTKSEPLIIFATCNRLETCLSWILEARGGVKTAFCIFQFFLFKPVKLTPVRYNGGQLYIKSRKAYEFPQI